MSSGCAPAVSPSKIPGVLVLKSDGRFAFCPSDPNDYLLLGHSSIKAIEIELPEWAVNLCRTKATGVLRIPGFPMDTGNTYRDRILKLLWDTGPLTTREIAARLLHNPKSVSTQLVDKMSDKSVSNSKSRS
jgi:hypothetical protein